MNFKETSSKDIFLRHLKGLPIDFGHILSGDKFAFIDFAVFHNMLKFICHKEYMGILGKYIVLKNFTFNMDREDNNRGKHFLRLQKGDSVEISELYPINHNGCHATVQSNNTIKYEIYIYVTDEERAKIYEM